jgi:hypothetical protein
MVSMAENKTKPTDASVDSYIASRASEQQQQADCKEADLDKSVLERLVAGSVAEVKTRYGGRIRSNVSRT